MNKIVAGHLNINSIRNKFNFLANQVQANIDILTISETRLDKYFPPGQFLLYGYSVPFRSHRDGNADGISLFIREEISSKFTQFIATGILSKRITKCKNRRD